MTVDLPHEQRCSCDHLAFQHGREGTHACGEVTCACAGYEAMREVDLLD